ncbi:5-formyltetrahydrofolate cyclo-ligase [Uruburuella testudinis]|uniref:5-formyltetrahydrofolate cyclo-ligase n=1 Tax=Uruburuella testudinis TaxID=1282863 RepID=A0ABY4DXD8_9NEIS|nr:5-formyltetrahydrofolate cyclo-ligase [Uruburuella testudinis]UOO82272.1 5-formyltetrahydrofolate cyclo-ligase [Uruburuella testudinis]
MPHTEKSDLRRQLRRARQSLSRRERAHATGRINRLLSRHIRRGAHIGVYWPIGSELRLDGFIQTAFKRGACVYLPYIEPNSLRLWFTPYAADAAQAERVRSRGRLKIPQFGGKKIRMHRLNTLLLPLVGIDKQGYRLGQGGGYYDVSLAATRHRLQPHKIGVGFACQLCDTLPHEAHDIKLDAFVCEHGTIRF